MNIIVQEWKSYQKQMIFWSIGILALLMISFYKVQGLSSTPGGLQEMMNSLPPALRLFFGSVSDTGTTIGSYRMIHLYVTIALALHAVILGAHIFAKEEFDKTFEFLYVKGVKRVKILLCKIFAGMVMLLLLDVMCLIGTSLAALFVGYAVQLLELMPYLLALFMTQLFFFSIALLISLVLPDNHKAGMIGCCIVFVMFMVSMYGKVGGSIDMLDAFSIFHYADAGYIQSHTTDPLPVLIIMLISGAALAVAEVVHHHRDLL